ncbi:hypothetical protein ACFXKJ_35840 [Kitasatospora indigofera]|uniref:hypothetical protein n=1 Tax=Kitasatospora indigofera TaxID=67307 RepID=UPI003649A7E1
MPAHGQDGRITRRAQLGQALALLRLPHGTHVRLLGVGVPLAAQGLDLGDVGVEVG